ncbi:MAG: ATP phosphoribosyltransferase regulatory subunit [Clostridia bacterium]|nr:ATP phosphoribosyltransferase regulatory subunit [Clostridia bacterium]
MKSDRCSTPLGTKDLLLEDSLIRREIENKLSSLFLKRGFSEVMTPGMEFFDVFTGGEHPAVPVSEMYKMTDTKGRLLVMRPDSTLPIARLAATRLQNAPLPLRLYYAQDVYHMNVGLTGRADQEFQAGIELIGAEGKRADLEVITLAASALKSVVDDTVRIEIGHVGFFESLMEELGADAATEAEIRDLIEGKNYAALSELLDTLEQGEVVDALRRLPHLFGGEKVLKKAQTPCRTARGQEALDYLASLYDDLRNMGLEEHVIFDLGMLHSNEYYTGMIFRGYIEGSGEIALSGGRYDALLQQFGAPRAATGFAINVDVLMRLLKKNGKFTKAPICKVLVHPEDGYEAKALHTVNALTADGIACEYSVFDTVEKAVAYAAAKRIERVDVIGEVCEMIKV